MPPNKPLDEELIQLARLKTAEQAKSEAEANVISLTARLAQVEAEASSLFDQLNTTRQQKQDLEAQYTVHFNNMTEKSRIAQQAKTEIEGRNAFLAERLTIAQQAKSNVEAQSQLQISNLSKQLETVLNSKAQAENNALVLRDQLSKTMIQKTRETEAFEAARATAAVERQMAVRQVTLEAENRIQALQQKMKADSDAHSVALAELVKSAQKSKSDFEKIIEIHQKKINFVENQKSEVEEILKQTTEDDQRKIESLEQRIKDLEKENADLEVRYNDMKTEAEHEKRTSNQLLSEFLEKPLQILKASWTVDETFDWIKTIIPLDQAQKLKDQLVDGKSLLCMTLADFKDCGLLVGPAKNLEAAVMKLKPRKEKKKEKWFFSKEALSTENFNWIQKGGDSTPYKSLFIEDWTQSNPITDLFNRCFSRMKNFNILNIHKMYAVNNTELFRSFLVYNNSMLGKWRSSANLFKSTDWIKSEDSDIRQAHYNIFHKYCTSFPWNENLVLPVVPMLHGTSRDTAWKIAQTGFATVATIDTGYYGRGIYFTSDVNYAKFYSEIASKSQKKLCLLLSLVIPGNIYPLTEDHTGPDSFLGKPVKGAGYQSHYTNVISSRNAEKFGHVCNPPQSDNYDELVVFQDAQALPLFIIEC